MGERTSRVSSGLLVIEDGEWMLVADPDHVMVQDAMAMDVDLLMIGKNLVAETMMTEQLSEEAACAYLNERSSWAFIARTENAARLMRQEIERQEQGDVG